MKTTVTILISKSDLLAYVRSRIGLGVIPDDIEIAGYADGDYTPLATTHAHGVIDPIRIQYTRDWR